MPGSPIAIPRIDGAGFGVGGAWFPGAASLLVAQPVGFCFSSWCFAGPSAATPCARRSRPAVAPGSSVELTIRGIG